MELIRTEAQMTYVGMEPLRELSTGSKWQLEETLRLLQCIQGHVPLHCADEPSCVAGGEDIR